MTSVVRPMSEEYINKENVFHDYDPDDEFWNSENSDFNSDDINVVAVTELKSIWKHLLVKIRTDFNLLL